MKAEILGIAELSKALRKYNQDTGTGAARDTYVTRDSSAPNPSSTSLVYALRGAGAGAAFTSSGTFVVPAGIFEITIQATGAGSPGQTRVVTIPVVPGESIGVFLGQNTGTGAARDTYRFS